MERRTALAIATAAAGTVLAASAAFAANVGLLEGDTSKPVGILDTSPVATTETTMPEPTVVTVIVEDPPLPVETPAAVPAPGAVAPAPAPAVSSSSSHEDDDRYQDDDHEDEGGYEDEGGFEDDDD